MMSCLAPMSSTIPGAVPGQGCFGFAPYPGDRLSKRQGPSTTGKQQRAGCNVAEDMQCNCGHSRRHRCDTICLSTVICNQKMTTQCDEAQLVLPTPCKYCAPAFVSMISNGVDLHADTILKAMSIALQCETVCVSLLTDTHTIISNGTGLLHPKMSFPLGICHWSLVPQDAQTIIVEDMLEDER